MAAGLPDSRHGHLDGKDRTPTARGRGNRPAVPDETVCPFTEDLALAEEEPTEEVIGHLTGLARSAAPPPGSSWCDARPMARRARWTKREIVSLEAKASYVALAAEEERVLQGTETQGGLRRVRHLPQPMPRFDALLQVSSGLSHFSRSRGGLLTTTARTSLWRSRSLSRLTGSSAQVTGTLRRRNR